jgi:multiple sugar transport system substrate-binding protein
MAGRRISAAIAAASVMVLAAACGGSSGGSAGASGDKAGVTTIEFSQWWEPELPKGSLRGLMDKFEAANPKIKVKLLSGPFASTKEQTIAGAAAGTMADVVGLDGAWVSDFVKQGAITDLSKLMKDAKYDQSQLAAQIKVDGSTYMIPVVNFVYPLFTNDVLVAKAGVSAPPSNRTEFLDAAK